jgi:enoyl-CoA hydratase/carnithine racemase
MEIDIIEAIRELNDHPDTVFTVVTGEGRFFCAGADVKAGPKGMRAVAPIALTIQKIDTVL